MKSAKKQIRTQVNTNVKKLSAQEIQQQGEFVLKKLMKMDFVVKSKRICLYINMPHELPTMELLKQLLGTAKVEEITS